MPFLIFILSLFFSQQSHATRFHCTPADQVSESPYNIKEIRVFEHPQNTGLKKKQKARLELLIEDKATHHHELHQFSYSKWNWDLYDGDYGYILTDGEWEGGDVKLTLHSFHATVKQIEDSPYKENLFVAGVLTLGDFEYPVQCSARGP